MTLDVLEKVYLRDSVNEADYTEICNRLLKQYKSNLSDKSVATAFVDLETFMHEWEVSLVSISLRS
jgi:ESCRT-I complex subunit VPS28